MELPSVLFCNSPKCKSPTSIKSKKALDGRSKNRVMARPVILPCDHGYCYDCTKDLKDHHCSCGQRFDDKDIKINSCMKAMCNWFSDNSGFIAAYISLFNDPDSGGEDNPPPSSSTLSPSKASVTRTKSTTNITTMESKVNEVERQPAHSPNGHSLNERPPSHSPNGHGLLERQKSSSPIGHPEDASKSKKDKPAPPHRKAFTRKIQIFPSTTATSFLMYNQNSPQLTSTGSSHMGNTSPTRAPEPVSPPNASSSSSSSKPAATTSSTSQQDSVHVTEAMKQAAQDSLKNTITELEHHAKSKYPVINSTPRSQPPKAVKEPRPKPPLASKKPNKIMPKLDSDSFLKLSVRQQAAKYATSLRRNASMHFPIPTTRRRSLPSKLNLAPIIADPEASEVSDDELAQPERPDTPRSLRPCSDTASLSHSASAQQTHVTDFPSPPATTSKLSSKPNINLAKKMGKNVAIEEEDGEEKGEEETPSGSTSRRKPHLTVQIPQRGGEGSGSSGPTSPTESPSGSAKLQKPPPRQSFIKASLTSLFMSRIKGLGVNGDSSGGSGDEGNGSGSTSVRGNTKNNNNLSVEVAVDVVPKYIAPVKYSIDQIKVKQRSPSQDDVKSLMKFLGKEMGMDVDWMAKPTDIPTDLHWSDSQEIRDQHRPMIHPKEGWNIEYGTAGIQLSNLVLDIEDKQSDTRLYREHFYGKSHGMLLGGTDDNPLLVVYEKPLPERSPPYKVIIRSKLCDERLMIPDVVNRKAIPKALKLENQNMFSVESSDLEQEIGKWEDRCITKQYKFGVLYCKAGQKTENEMFGNKDESLEFAFMLECLGEKIRLKKWNKFAAGLNTDEDLDGKYSVFSSYKGYEVMFHVSTFLTHISGDPQQLEKKRHIGNDIVVIVFMEDGGVLDPGFTRTQFNHVFIVIQPVRTDSSSSQSPTLKYRIAVTGKQGVRPFGPKLPEICEFERGPQMREFLLAKLINAERAALRSPNFLERLTTGRRLFLSSLRSQYEKK